MVSWGPWKKIVTLLITVADTATGFDCSKANVKSRLFQPPVCNRSIFAIFFFFSIRRHFTSKQYSWLWLEFFQKVWAFLFGAYHCFTAEETEAKGDILVSRIKLSCRGFAASCSSSQRQRVRDWLSNSIFKEFAVLNVIWTKFFFFLKILLFYEKPDTQRDCTPFCGKKKKRAKKNCILFNSTYFEQNDTIFYVNRPHWKLHLFF